MHQPRSLKGGRQHLETHAGRDFQNPVLAVYGQGLAGMTEPGMALSYSQQASDNNTTNYMRNMFQIYKLLTIYLSESGM
jgi:hypothetical protein